jgi:hypothetical protein
MDRRPVGIVFMLTLLPGAALAQNAGYPTPAEYAERALASERAPLFQSHEPLRITLRTDIEWLVDERIDSVEVEGTVTFVDLDGSEASRPVQVRARGEFRRDRRNCNFPPLRLNFPTGQMGGTVFEGEDRLKLVTPCHDNRDDFQRFVYDEYLAYRVLNLLTPHSFRVRLVEITYEDTEGDYDTRTKHGFLIESDERMAERNRATYMEVAVLPPRSADGAQSVVGDVFSYMIGNLDWSTAEFHNAVLIRTEDARYVTVPYDFDFSGVVNARYATVPEQLAGRVRNVRQRLYRGFCRPALEHETVANLFGLKREAVEELYRGFGLYRDPDHAEDALEYYEDFWEVIADPGEFEDEILDVCREMP